MYSELKSLLSNKMAASGPKGMKANTKITEDVLAKYSHGQWWQFGLKDAKAMAGIERLKKQLDEALERLEGRFQDKVEKLQSGDELPPGVLKMVKVFVAVKRKMQAGDKVAGRHGNKGVISRIVPHEDMPWLADGTSIDILLNPLGVPSRMNVGQILETHLGWAARGIGRKVDAMIEDIRHGGDSKELRKFLNEVYGEAPKSGAVAKLG